MVRQGPFEKFHPVIFYCSARKPSSVLTQNVTGIFGPTYALPCKPLTKIAINPRTELIKLKTAAGARKEREHGGALPSNPLWLFQKTVTEQSRLLKIYNVPVVRKSEASNGVSHFVSNHKRGAINKWRSLALWTRIAQWSPFETPWNVTFTRPRPVVDLEAMSRIDWQVVNDRMGPLVCVIMPTRFV